MSQTGDEGSRPRRKSGGVHKRMQPPETVTDPAQPRHFRIESLDVAPVPTIAHQERDRARSHRVGRPLPMESSQAFAKTGSPTPVRNLLARPSNCLFRNPSPERLRQSCEPCAQRKDLHLLRGSATESVAKVKVSFAESSHRSAYIKEQQELPSLL